MEKLLTMILINIYIKKKISWKNITRYNFLLFKIVWHLHPQQQVWKSEKLNHIKHVKRIYFA